MKYEEFRRRVFNAPVFSSSLLRQMGGDIRALRNQLVRWEKRGLVCRLRRGLYLLREEDRRKPVSRMFAANQIYAPSYVSTEYAMDFYGLIPERVADVTSVTPRKTYQVENKLGKFVFQHVSQKAFSGFLIVRDEAENPCLIASPEKALVDFIYLNLSRFPRDRDDVFTEFFRFQNLSRLDPRQLVRSAGLFANGKLTRVVERLVRLQRTQP